jgi:RNA polymerase sigma-70 factor (ECF subfamily)
MAESSKDAADWLTAARAGSREALGEALETCRRYLLLVAERQLGADLQAKGGASDLVQETFLEAQRDFAQFHGNSEAELLAWLRRLLLNNLGHFARRYRDTHSRAVAREVRPPPDGSSNDVGAGLVAAALSPSGQAMEQEQAQALQRALQRLPEDYRLVITLRYLDELTFEEIGLRMNRSADAARKLWSRAMDQLRQEWKGPP